MSTFTWTVRSSLQFMVKEARHLEEKPYALEYESPESNIPRRNFVTAPVEDVEIHDIRPVKDSLSLDREGIVVAEMQTKMAYKDFFDETKITNVFAEELREYLLESLHARRIYFYECLVRKRNPNFPLPDTQKSEYGQPIPVAHADFTLDAIKTLIKEALGPESEALLKGRFQALNVWKPLRGPLLDWPLAMCDLTSLDLQEDLVAADDVRIQGYSELYQVTYNPGQKWCYLHEQRDSELLIFRTADSDLEGGVPHCAFKHPACPAHEKPRESIEVRALVFY